MIVRPYVATTHLARSRMRDLLAVIDSQSGTATGDEIAAIDEFNDSLRANGQWVIAVGIADPSHATVIDNRSNAGLVSAGPLHDLDDYMAGLWIIDVDSHDTALSLAQWGSRACNRRLEMRPLL
jgi:hypothetical protein